MRLSRSFSDSVLSVQCYIILWIARRVLCGESFLGHSICPHVNCCHGDQLRSYCLVKPLDLSPTSGSAIVQSLSDRQSESTMLSGSDLPELVLLFVAYICSCFSKPFWLVALNGTLNLLNQILKQHSSWFSTGMHFQFEILLLLPKETLWHYINIRTGKRRLSYACLLFCCNRLVILKQGYPQLFFIPALRGTSTRLCVHLWCLCWIIKAREMFQRSKKIPVSEERRMREQVRNAEWERQRERPVLRSQQKDEGSSALSGASFMSGCPAKRCLRCSTCKAVNGFMSMGSCCFRLSRAYWILRLKTGHCLELNIVDV